MVSILPAVIDPQISSQRKRIALVGNPNTGKTTLFNSLTGLNLKVSNYPGVTVERKVGRFTIGSREFDIVDLPGTYSLSAHSPDEMVVTDILLNQQSGEEPVDLVIAIVDASNLNRHFYLVSQLFELDLPIIIALNMMDIAEGRGIQIDVEGLSKRLGVPIVPMCANHGRGIEELRTCIDELEENKTYLPREKALFPEHFRQSLQELRVWLTSQEKKNDRLIPEPELFRAFVDEKGIFEKRLVKNYGTDFQHKLEEMRQEVKNSRTLSAMEAKIRYNWIASVLNGFVTYPKEPVLHTSDKIDRILLHKVYGTAIFLLMIALIFQSIFSWATPVMDAIDGLFSALAFFVTTWMSEGMLRSMITDGVISGVGGVMIFLPQIVILFFFIAILEDCGYLPRAAALMDRLLYRFGLSGQSFIPMLSSFACAVPGIMATRTISDRHSRLLTILILPLMSCSARLPVYLIFIAAFVPNQTVLGNWLNLQGLALLGMYLIGTLFALLMALLFKTTMMRGKPSYFILEMPTYKWPVPRTVMLYVYARAMDFILRAGTIILCVSIIVWAFAYFPHPDSIAQKYERLREQEQRNMVQETLPKLIAIQPDSFHSSMDTENLQETIESNSVFQSPAPNTPAAEVMDEYQNYRNAIDKINAAENGEYVRQSMLGRMGRWIEPVVEPLGWDWRIGMATLASFPARELVVAALSTILNIGVEEQESPGGLREAIIDAKREDGAPLFNLAVVFSLMVFFALCCQCAATLATIKRETNSWKWPLFTFGYMTVLAYGCALVTYQLGVYFGLA